MISSVATSLSALPSLSPGMGIGGGHDQQKEVAAIKAELLSARSEKQCTECEGDKAKLDQQIQALETRLNQVRNVSSVQEPRPAFRYDPVPDLLSADAVPAAQALAQARGEDGDRRVGGSAPLTEPPGATAAGETQGPLGRMLAEAASTSSEDTGGNSRRPAYPGAPGSLLDITV